MSQVDVRQRVALVVVTIAALVAGGLLVGEPTDSSFTIGSVSVMGSDDIDLDDASELILAFYEDADVEALADAFDPRFFGTIPRDAVIPQLAQLLRPGMVVGDARIEEVAGVQVGVITTADGVPWCVRPDDVVLALCQVGEQPATLTGPGLVGEFVSSVLQVGAVRVDINAFAAGTDPVTIGNSLELVDAPAGWSVLDAGMVRGETVIPLPTETAELQDGLGLRIAVQWVGGPEGPEPTTLRVTWDGGFADIQVGHPVYWLR